jgi:hypothetical protein
VPLPIKDTTKAPTLTLKHSQIQLKKAPLPLKDTSKATTFTLENSQIQLEKAPFPFQVATAKAAQGAHY